jgi:hypothetical protein
MGITVAVKSPVWIAPWPPGALSFVICEQPRHSIQDQQILNQHDCGHRRDGKHKVCLASCDPLPPHNAGSYLSIAKPPLITPKMAASGTTICPGKRIELF